MNRNKLSRKRFVISDENINNEKILHSNSKIELIQLPIEAEIAQMSVSFKNIDLEKSSSFPKTCLKFRKLSQSILELEHLSAQK